MARGRVVLAVITAVALSSGGSALAQGTLFSYQGMLVSNGLPANGTFDFQFVLYDALTKGSAVSATITNTAVPVSNGLFTVTLDFGSGPFSGADRWLEVGARSNAVGAFTLLAPRQQLTPAPYAIRAANFSGVIAGAQLGGTYGSGVEFTNPANHFIGMFSGDGGGLVNLNASNLASGTVPDARLAPNVLRTNQAWLLNGNAGTALGLNFLGTSDNQALEVRANNRRGLLLQPASLSPNLIGGDVGNFVAPPVSGGTIGGGGTAGAPNAVLDNFGVVGGGLGNFARLQSVVGGGSNNAALGTRAVVAGGSLNVASNTLAAVGGGQFNVAAGFASVVAGGGGTDPLVPGLNLTNLAAGNWSVVGGGRANTSSGQSATVSGGEGNEATGNRATASGGIGNRSQSEFSTVGGGSANTASVLGSTVSGGEENGALNVHATVGGGVGNYALGDKSTVGGGANNLSPGPYSSVPGGQQAQAMQYGQMALAAGNFAAPGDAQRSVYVLRNLTDIAHPTSQLFLDGAGARLSVPPNHTFTFDILVVARAAPPLTDSAGYSFRGVVKDNAGFATFVGAPVATVLGQNQPWTVTLGLLGSEFVLRVDSTGYADSIRWTARVETAEVAW